MRPGADILSTERNSVYIFFMSSEQLEISHSNFETLIKDLKEISLNSFLKIGKICAFKSWNFWLLHTNYKFLDIGTYTEHSQTSKTDYFAKIFDV